MSDHLTLRLAADVAKELARRAGELGVGKSHVVREAVARYLASSSEPRVTGVSARVLADRWRALPRLTPDEAAAFGADLDASREAVPPPRSAWE